MPHYQTHHTGLTVRDLAAASSFYRRAFGFAEQLSFELPGGIAGAVLRTPAGAGLELFGVANPEPGLSGATPPHALRRSGFGHLALGTDDLDAAYAEALGAGAASVWEPRPAPEPGKRMAFVHDPEGNLIELIGDAR